MMVVLSTALSRLALSPICQAHVRLTAWAILVPFSN